MIRWLEAAGFALIVGIAAGSGFGVAFNVATKPTLDRAERVVARIEKILTP